MRNTSEDEVGYLITEAGLEALRAAEGMPLADDGEEAAPDAFFPDTPEKVDWVLGKMADCRAVRIRENAETMAREQERQAEHLEWRYGAALQAFLRGQIAGTSRRSVRLLNGMLGFRLKPASVSLTSEPEARAWAEANLPQALRVNRRLLTERLLTTGEAVEGTQLVPAEEVFYIK